MTYQPPFNLESAIEALSKRCSFSLVRAIFQKNELSPGTGWDALRDKVDASKNQKAGEYAALVVETYLAQLCLGSRAIALYAGPSDANASINWNAIAASASALSPGAGPFSNAYPIPLPASTLQTLDPAPQLVEVRQLSANDIALIFCSPRVVTDRKTFKENQVGTDVRSAIGQFLGDFQQVILVNNFYYQAFDVMVVRRQKERIELRLDTKETDSEILTIFANRVLERAQDLISGLSAINIAGPVNLFPAIESIYKDPNEGNVLALGFQTHTSSIKRERMRHGGENLRTETFHEAGMLAVQGDIQPFSITVGWDSLTPELSDYEVKVSLPGSVRLLAGANAELVWAQVRDCATERQFNTICNKLISHSG